MASACSAVRAREAWLAAGATCWAAWATLPSSVCTVSWSASYCSPRRCFLAPRFWIRAASALACALRSEI